jgi:ABC-2 type transport system ATP-binding protein
VADPRGAKHFLESAGYAVTTEPDHLVVEGHEHPEHITRLLAERRIYVQELTAIRPTLESFFLKLTGSPTSSPGRSAGKTSSKEKDS